MWIRAQDDDEATRCSAQNIAASDGVAQSHTPHRNQIALSSALELRVPCVAPELLLWVN